mmetsp:Transcript_38819/g.78307  ORF Transcript_38819/g.78307 Transcript_38819/m.78307 type:complete len:357 (-) Transcript_38819:168-1238(-)
MGASRALITVREGNRTFWINDRAIAESLAGALARESLVAEPVAPLDEISQKAAVVEASLRTAAILAEGPPIPPLAAAVQALRRLNGAANAAKHGDEAVRSKGKIVEHIDIATPPSSPRAPVLACEAVATQTEELEAAPARRLRSIGVVTSRPRRRSSGTQSSKHVGHTAVHGGDELNFEGEGLAENAVDAVHEQKEDFVASDAPAMCHSCTCDETRSDVSGSEPGSFESLASWANEPSASERRAQDEGESTFSLSWACTATDGGLFPALHHGLLLQAKLACRHGELIKLTLAEAGACALERSANHVVVMRSACAALHAAKGSTRCSKVLSRAKRSFIEAGLEERLAFGLLQFLMAC